MWVFWLFMYWLMTIPAALVLGVVARITNALPVRRAMEIVILSGGFAILPVLAERASQKPLLWIAIVPLLAILVAAAVRTVRTWNTGQGRDGT